ncbi:MAG: hypothetical protein ACXWL5_04890 [Candidatus Chromulinivorax sp.]
MIKLHVTFVTIFITLFTSLWAEFEIFDQGVVVVGNTMITYTDVHDKLDLDGTKIPLDRQIKMEIINQQIIADKMPLDATAADKYLANIQKMNNMTLEDLDDLAMQCHRTFPELKQLLHLRYAYDFFLYHKFRAHLVPSDQDVQDYCDENPLVEPGYCTIQVAFVDFTSENKEQVLEKVQGIIAGKVSVTAVDWSDKIKVNIADIADDKLFIKDMQVDEIAMIEDKKSFELYRLVDIQQERVVPLTERKASVIEHLNRKMYEDMLAEYEKHIMDDVAIIKLVE